jgi:glycine cleavage system H protein
MLTHDPYLVKAVEYLSCLAFLGLFAAFWTFVNGGGMRAVNPAQAFAHLTEWFRVPDAVFFHPGHAWAKPIGTGRALVGLDDFAQRLLGPIGAVVLPKAGTELHAGAPAWSVTVDGKTVEMLSPVSGTVAAVNTSIADHPDVLNEDPYGRGWLLSIDLPQPRKSFADLVSGTRAHRWMTQVAEDLSAALTPELGHLCQDGGVPINGFARGIDDAHWDDVARKFLLS